MKLRVPYNSSVVPYSRRGSVGVRSPVILPGVFFRASRRFVCGQVSIGRPCPYGVLVNLNNLFVNTSHNDSGHSPVSNRIAVSPQKLILRPFCKIIVCRLSIRVRPVGKIAFANIWAQSREPFVNHLICPHNILRVKTVDFFLIVGKLLTVYGKRDVQTHRPESHNSA